MRGVRGRGRGAAQHFRLLVVDNALNPALLTRNPKPQEPSLMDHVGECGCGGCGGEGGGQPSILDCPLSTLVCVGLPDQELIEE